MTAKACWMSVRVCAVSYFLPSVLKPTLEVPMVAATNATATMGTVLLICPNQVTQSNNNDYLSQEASQNLEPERPQVPPSPSSGGAGANLWQSPAPLGGSAWASPSNANRCIASGSMRDDLLAFDDVTASSDMCDRQMSPTKDEPETEPRWWRTDVRRWQNRRHSEQKWLFTVVYLWSTKPADAGEHS